MILKTRSSHFVSRVLVIIVEDSLLHPAAPLLTWLMVATSKGYRPPSCLLEAFLCVVHETAACSVRDSTDSCRRRHHRRFRSHQDHQTAGTCSPGTATTDQQQQQQQQPELVKTKSFNSEEFPVPHPKSLLVSPSCRGDADGSGGGNAATGAAVANIRRALLMRVSYGGMPCDQALLKGACLAWGERCGHYHDCSLCDAAGSSASSPAHALDGSGSGGAACLDGEHAPGSDDGVALMTAPLLTQQQQQQPPDPPRWTKGSSRSPSGSACIFEPDSGDVGALPFNYTHESVLAALQGNGWSAFLTAAHSATGMPPALRSQLMAHVAGKGSSGGTGDGGEETANHATQREAGGTKPPATNASMPPSRLGPILREADAILSGVDFHCSGVLDDLLRSTAVAARVGKAIQRRGNRINNGQAGWGALLSGDAGQKHEEGSVRATSSAGGSGVSSDEEVVGVRQAAKQAMWACSGALNVRRLRVVFCSNGGEERCHGDGGKQRGQSKTTGCGGGCWSSPGFLEELPGVRAVAGDGDVVVPGDGGGASSPDINTRVWSAISSDVLGWTGRFVRGRVARG